MKKILIALALIVPIISVVSCQHKTSERNEIVSQNIDSIRHARINDSINNLDTIRILNSLFMGMTQSQFDSLKEFATPKVEIENIVFDKITASQFHGKIHNINFKGEQDFNYLLDMEELAKCILNGEKSFDAVVETLSAKYGKPNWECRMSTMDKRGHQYGLARWCFDKFEVSYTQHHWAYPKQLSLTINSEITYSIPREYTEQEIQEADSIIKVRQQELIKQEEAKIKAKGTL